jgi:hypothetical protein
MAYGTTNVDTIQSSTANTPVVFKDGNGTQIGTLCRAWVNFNGTGTVAIRASFNVSSITDNGTGNYNVNFTTAMPDADYAAFVTCKPVDTGGSISMGNLGYYGSATSPMSTTSVRVMSQAASAGVADTAYMCVSVFR